MLLWISAAGLAGASWFGWLVWQDYDWAAFGWSGLALPGGLPSGRSAHSPGVPSKTGHISGSPSPDNDDDNLLGSTQTAWSTGQPIVVSSQEVTDNSQVTDNETVGDDKKPSVGDTAEPDTEQPSAPVADKPNTGVAETEPQAVAIPSVTPDADAVDGADVTASDEDFVVVGSGMRQRAAITAQPGNTGPLPGQSDPAHEDFVAFDPWQKQDNDLPEIDLTDYVTQWHPIVPKIAAMITHELWPQLRSYLESLPQFGDVNLERVVNAVAEDTVGPRSVGPRPVGVPVRRHDSVGVHSEPETGDTDGVGEETANGFAFYAHLFEQMEDEAEDANGSVTEDADLMLA